jgi:endonuclease/exonuclease/phosphatase family metal-dependent hydrolase
MRRVHFYSLALSLLPFLAACGGVDDTPFSPPDAVSDDSDELRRRKDAGQAPLPDAGAPGPDASTPAPTLRVMTWNTENFFDDVDDPKKEDTVLTAAQVDAKIAALAKVINAVQPDVLSLQEVENEPLLQRLGNATGLPNVKLVRSYDYRGINVAIATRLTILSVVSHQGEHLYAPDGRGPYYWARDCLEVHLAGSAGHELVILVNHQTSQLDSSLGDPKRQAQARRAREIADELRAQDSARPVIIAGDMNDEPGSASSQLYVAGNQYLDVAEDVPSADRYTYSYNGHRRYDFILPSADLAALRTAVTILHSADVRAASDHAPIVAAFAWP